MKKMFKKLKEFHVPEGVVSVCLVLALIVVLLPILRLAMYATPWYDDYSYTQLSKGWMIQLNSWTGVFKGAYETARIWWHCWQGTYSSIALMSLSPLIFGEEYYWIGIVAIILFFVFACMLLSKVACQNIMKANKKVQITVASLVTITLIEFVYDAQQGLFWYNSAVHYTFMHGVLFILIAVLIKMFYAKKHTVLVCLSLLATLLTAVCGGANFVSVLQGFLSLLIAIFLMVLYKRRAVFYCILPTLVYGYGLYKNLSAPGNAIRGANFQGYGAMESVFYSFVSAFKNFWSLTGIGFFLVLALYVLIIWNTVKEMKCEFRFPGLVSFFSVCFYATGYTSSYYGMGSEGAARTWVVIKFTLLILLFFNATYWLGWGMRQWNKKEREVRNVKQWFWYYSVIGVGMLCCLLFTEAREKHFSTVGSFYYLHTGQASNHYAEYMQRVEIIENSGPNVEVEQMYWTPGFLFKGDLSTNPNEDENKAMAKWYGKETISVIIKNEED